MFKIMYFIGLIGSAISLITTVYLFFICNVIEILKDLTGIKIVKKKEVVLAGATDTVLPKRRTSTRKNNTDDIKVMPIDYEEKSKIKDTIVKTEVVSKDKKVELSSAETDLVDEDTNLIEEETDLLTEETGLLDEETGLLDEETELLDEATGLIEEETNMLEEVLADGEYVKEIDTVVVNYDSIINI